MPVVSQQGWAPFEAALPAPMIPGGTAAAGLTPFAAGQHAAHVAPTHVAPPPPVQLMHMPPPPPVHTTSAAYVAPTPAHVAPQPGPAPPPAPARVAHPAHVAAPAAPAAPHVAPVAAPAVPVAAPAAAAASSGQREQSLAEQLVELAARLSQGSVGTEATATSPLQGSGKPAARDRGPSRSRGDRERLRLAFLATIGSLDELATDTAQREGLGDVAGLRRCMEEVCRFEYFDDEFG